MNAFIEQHYKCPSCEDSGLVTHGGPVGYDEDGNTEYDAWQEPCDCDKGIAMWNAKPKHKVVEQMLYLSKKRG